MRIYWHNGALEFRPEKSEEWKALEVIRASLESVAFDDGFPSLSGKQEMEKID